MTIGSVDWGAHAADTLEEVAAVLLAQEAPDAIRRTPSSGDGGVDVLVPIDGGWHVHQVKSFTGRINGARRRQVESSLAEAIERPRLSKREVTAWSLVVPVDPTSDEQEWFETITASAPFDCTWHGKVWWDAEASRHGHVIDYYFRDGRQRIEERVKAMTGAADLMGRPPTAIDIATQLEVMRRRLELEDPHYRYSFHIGDLPLNRATVPEGAVLLRSQPCSEGNGFWTVYLSPKHRYSLTDCPIRGELTITAFDKANGIDIRDQLQDFRDFGCKLDVPESAASGTLRAPGGLSTSFDGGRLTISPLEPTDGLLESRLRMTAPAGRRSEVILRTTVRSNGENGGGELQAQDESRLLHLKARLMPPDAEGSGGVWWRVTLGDVVDRPVTDVLPLVQLLDEAAQGGELVWMERHGATIYARHDFSVSTTGDDANYVRRLRPILEDLAAVQERVAGAVLVPEALDSAEMRDLHDTATMIREGPLTGTWTEGAFRLRPGIDREPIERTFEKGGQLLQTGPMVLRLGDQVYELGSGYRYYRQAVLAPRQPLDDRQIGVCAAADAYTEHGLGTFPGRGL